jgi:hypothetical protein
MLVRVNVRLSLRPRIAIPPALGGSLIVLQETYSLELAPTTAALLVTAVGLLMDQLASRSRRRMADPGEAEAIDACPSAPTEPAVRSPGNTVETDYFGVDCTGQCVRIKERVHLLNGRRVVSRRVVRGDPHS